MSRIDWKDFDVSEIISYCNDSYERYYNYPSVRDIFYAFVDRWFPNTKNSYFGLVRLLTKKRLSGEIDWKLIRDGAGREFLKVEEWDYVLTPGEIFEGAEWRYNSAIKESKNAVENAIKEAKSNFRGCAWSYQFRRWYKQPHNVIVLCEKEADYPVLRNLVAGLDIGVGFMRGYSGKRLMFEVVEEFKNYSRKPVILTLGDYDPSGEDIKANIGRDMEKIGAQCILHNIAVTKEQIEEFELPHRPEDESEIAKLRRDPRYKNWKDGLYRVETAALRIREPDYFDKMVVDAVNSYFDEDIYEQVKEQERNGQEQIRTMVNQKLSEEDL